MEPYDLKPLCQGFDFFNCVALLSAITLEYAAKYSRTGKLQYDTFFIMGYNYVWTQINQQFYVFRKCMNSVLVVLSFLED